MSNHTAKHPVSAVETTVAILETIREKGGATLQDLDEELDFAKSTIHRHLSTLRQEGYVIQQNRTYDISLHLFDLASYNREQNPLFQVGRPTADEVAQKIEERVSLVVEEQQHAVKCYIAESNRSVTTDAHLGLAMQLHCTSGGKAILAAMDEATVAETLDDIELREMTDNTITDRDRLLEELEQIRADGVAFDDQERLVGVRGVAAPVVDKESGMLLGAFDIAGPATRIDGDEFRDRIPDIVKHAADEIAVNVQYWRNR